MSAVDNWLAPDLERRFGGVARLYGDIAAARLRAAHVAVVGIGGVGSWAAEALARCAIGHITLIDMDHVSESNTNRQIQALGDAYGESKIDAMAARISAINPAVRVTLVDEFVSAENAGRLIASFDIVLDCIDQVSAKAGGSRRHAMPGSRSSAAALPADGSIRCASPAVTWPGSPATHCCQRCVNGCGATTDSRRTTRAGRASSKSLRSIPTSRSVRRRSPHRSQAADWPARVTVRASWSPRRWDLLRLPRH